LSNVHTLSTEAFKLVPVDEPKLKLENYTSETEHMQAYVSGITEVVCVT